MKKTIALLATVFAPSWVLAADVDTSVQPTTLYKITAQLLDESGAAINDSQFHVVDGKEMNISKYDEKDYISAVNRNVKDPLKIEFIHDVLRSGFDYTITCSPSGEEQITCNTHGTVVKSNLPPQPESQPIDGFTVALPTTMKQEWKQPFILRVGETGQITVGSYQFKLQLNSISLMPEA